MPENIETAVGQSSSAIKFEFMPAADYRDDLLELAGCAGEIVVLQAMGFAYDESTEPILKQTLRALQQDRAEGLILPDYYSRLYADHGFRFSHRSSQRRAVRSHNVAIDGYMSDLREAGGRTRYVHPYMGRGRRLNAFPLAGRNHAKIARVDDVVWTFGGVNFSQLSFQNHDYMLRAESPELARIVTEYAEEHLHTGRSSRKEDIEQVLDSENVLLIDVGLPGQSIIYEKAIELSRTADESVLFVSQFAPEGKLKRELNKKQEEISPDNVRIVFNGPEKYGFPVSWEQRIVQSLDSMAHETTAEGYIHAKFMIFRFSDGRRFVLSGSNNFNAWGIRFGTAEIALLSSNPELIDKFEEYALSLPTVEAGK